MDTGKEPRESLISERNKTSSANRDAPGTSSGGGALRERDVFVNGDDVVADLYELRKVITIQLCITRATAGVAYLWRRTRVK